MKLAAFQVPLALITIILLPIAVMSAGDYSADSLYSFSQAKDILQFGSIIGWNY
jgi:hypothetical protein